MWSLRLRFRQLRASNLALAWPRLSAARRQQPNALDPFVAGFRAKRHARRTRPGRGPPLAVIRVLFCVLFGVLFGFVAGPVPALAQEPPAAPTITNVGPFAVDEGETAVATLAATDDDTVTADLVWSITGGTDSGTFSLTVAGVLSFTAAKDYEQPDDADSDGTYEVTVQVSDGANTDSANLTVAIANIDEAGALTLGPGQPRVGAVSRARLSDPDGVTSVTWRWQRSTDGNTWTAASSGTREHYVAVADDAGMYLRVTAQYSDGHGSGRALETAFSDRVAEREASPSLTVTTLVSGLTIPWDLAFAPDGTMLFTQRSGVLSSRTADGTVRRVTADFSDIYTAREAGLMAIAIDPSFSTNRRFYTCQTSSSSTTEVVAWTIDASYTTATRANDPLVGNIPGAPRHTGCRLRFGPSGYLWIATGDTRFGPNPQDLNSLGGKVLRVRPANGAAAPGNPFGSRVYTYRHRNVQGLALRPGTNQMWAVEHGPAWDDEINLLVSGGNYGWDPGPVYDEEVPMTDLVKHPSAIEAKWSSGEARPAPSGGIFLDGFDWGGWEGRLAVANLRGASLHLFEFTAAGALVSEVVVPELDGTHGRLRTPVIGPDGALYLTTSNGSGADKILKVVPSRAPEFASTTLTLEVEENSGIGALIGTVSASDPDNETLTYTLSGRDGASFTIDQTAALRSAEDFDYETKRTYEIVITATDPYGLSDSVDVVVNIEPVNDPPIITGDASPNIEEEGSLLVGTYRAADPENATVAWQPLGGIDADQFSFNASNGRLSFKTAPDYEDAQDSGSDNVYDVILSVSAGGHTTEMDVAVSVTNKDEAGALAFPITRSQEEATYTATLNDPDGVISTTWTWERSTSRTSGWAAVSGAIDGSTSSTYTPVAGDVGYYLRATASYEDGHAANKRLVVVSSNTVRARPAVNNAPEFDSETTTRSITEHARGNAAVGARVTASDPDSGDTMRYELDPASDLFTIDPSSGQIRVKETGSLDYESAPSHRVTVKASDSSNESDTIEVAIMVTNVNESPEASDDQADVDEDDSVRIDVLSNDSDPEFDDLRVSLSRGPRNGTASVDPVSHEIVYRPRRDYHGSDSLSYVVRDQGGLTDTGEVALFVRSLNDPPRFAAGPLHRRVAPSAQAGDEVGSAVQATDVDSGLLTYGLSGPDASFFEIDSGTGQITVGDGVAFDPLVQSEYSVTVEARDEEFARAEVTVSITVIERVQLPSIGGFGGGGGGGAPAITLPSDEDFEYNVTRDIEMLDRENDLPTGIWSDGAVIWVLNNADAGSDSVFAYDLETGERRKTLDFPLDSRNRFSHGIWSDGVTAWIADSGGDRIFAYDLATGERAEDREFDLAEDNRDPRGIWSDGETIYVLDAVRDLLFAYDLESGELLASYALDKLNRNPRGIWSDGVTIWISDDGAIRVFAYRLVDGELQRFEDEEFSFRSLLKAGNGDARGIWSDGDVMYVVDEQDDTVYTYNIPDSTIAWLGSLSLTELEIGSFAPQRLEYSATAAQGLSTTTITAMALQEQATVIIEPEDSDDNRDNGHQVSLDAETAVAIAVRSEDGSRTRTYRVVINRPPCVEGLTEQRLSQVTFVGGSIDELRRCARGLDLSALYHHRNGTWTALFVSQHLPQFLSHPFHDRFAAGVPAGELFVALRQQHGGGDLDPSTPN